MPQKNQLRSKAARGKSVVGATCGRAAHVIGYTNPNSTRPDPMPTLLLPTGAKVPKNGPVESFRFFHLSNRARGLGAKENVFLLMILKYTACNIFPTHVDLSICPIQPF